MSEQPESVAESQGVPLYRYPVAVVACVVVAGVCFGLSIALGVLIFEYLGPWIDRQVWVVRTALKIVFGVIVCVALGASWAATTAVWSRITNPAVPSTGQTHGRHARWYPGRPANADQGEGEHGRCPRCEFSYAWNGTLCSHCGYATDA
jgi:hypothetical protein